MKRETYSHKLADAARDKRREDAEARNTRFAALSVDEKLALIKTRRGESKRQVAKLQREKEKE